MSLDPRIAELLTGWPEVVIAVIRGDREGIATARSGLDGGRTEGAEVFTIHSADGCTLAVAGEVVARATWPAIIAEGRARSTPQARRRLDRLHALNVRILKLTHRAGGRAIAAPDRETCLALHDIQQWRLARIWPVRHCMEATALAAWCAKSEPEVVPLFGDALPAMPARRPARKPPAPKPVTDPMPLPGQLDLLEGLTS